MFGIDFETLVVLAILAFILFGPQKLPEYAEKLGRLVAKLRQASSELTQQVQNPFQYPLEPSAHRPTCPHCLASVGPEATFCTSCGRRLKEPTPPPPARRPTCPQCFHPVGPGFNFCPGCGQRLPAEAPAPPPPAPLAS